MLLPILIPADGGRTTFNTEYLCTAQRKYNVTGITTGSPDLWA